MKKIPVCEPVLAGNELKYVTEAVAGGWISSSGPFVERFEREFAQYLGVKHAITACNGTVALHLGLVAAGVGPGDEVIIPTFTMIASAFAVCYTGAKPVFVDCERATWNMQVEQIAAKITKRTKAIMPVHIYGHPCDMAPIMELAREHDLVVLEDAAEAIGSEYRGAKCGAIGDLAGFSLFANKAITTGEGGMVTTNSDKLAERCRYFKNLCFPLSGPRVYLHEEIGFNYRMPNTLAAIGVAQLERVEELVAGRRNNARRYEAGLRGVRGVTLQPELPGARSSYWMYSILIEDDFGVDREAVIAGLLARGVETRRFFIPMHQQPALVKYGCDVAGDYRVAEDIAGRGLYLPSGSALSDADIAYVCDSLAALRRS